MKKHQRHAKSFLPNPEAAFPSPIFTLTQSNISSSRALMNCSRILSPATMTFGHNIDNDNQNNNNVNIDRGSGLVVVGGGGRVIIIGADRSSARC